MPTIVCRSLVGKTATVTLQNKGQLVRIAISLKSIMISSFVPRRCVLLEYFSLDIYAINSSAKQLHMDTFVSSIRVLCINSTKDFLCNFKYPSIHSLKYATGGNLI